MSLQKIVYAFIASIVATLTISLAITATPAAASPRDTLSGFLGQNPSGKLDRTGQPLWSKRSLEDIKKKYGLPSKEQPQQTSGAECPPTIKCVVMPAAYSPNAGNVEDYGNYDKADRPNDMEINSVVIHDTEGDLDSVLAAFKDPSFYASTHYVIAPDGTVYQMIPTKDIAWHAGNWHTNMHSIGIEHVGYSADSSSYTPAMYRSSQELVKYLSQKFDIPRDRGHIIGHDNVAAISADRLANMHFDPGPFWNWQQYTAGIHAPVWPWFDATSPLITIAPAWGRNQQPVTGCADEEKTSCVPAGLQPTNFISLRLEPRHDAPLFTDPVIGQGTTEISNNAARLFYGQKFAVADRKLTQGGIWYQVWINGVKGWFFSPLLEPTAFPAKGSVATVKADAIVYGRPIPEKAEYPADLLASPPGSFHVPAPTPLPYKLTTGQRYQVISQDVPTDHFYAWASDSSFPYDHTVFKGKTKYIQVQLGNRIGYVKASDVTITK